VDRNVTNVYCVSRMEVEVRESLVDRNAHEIKTTPDRIRRGSREPRGSKCLGIESNCESLEVEVRESLVDRNVTSAAQEFPNIVEVRESLVDRNIIGKVINLSQRSRGSREPRGSKLALGQLVLIRRLSRFARASWIEIGVFMIRLLHTGSRFARASWIEI